MEDQKDVGAFQSLLSRFLSVYRDRSVDTIGTTYVEKNTSHFQTLYRRYR